MIHMVGGTKEEAEAEADCLSALYVPSHNFSSKGQTLVRVFI